MLWYVLSIAFLILDVSMLIINFLSMITVIFYILDDIIYSILILIVIIIYYYKIDLKLITFR